MNQSELVERIRSRLDVPVKQAGVILHAVCGEIVDGLADAKEVATPMGTFRRLWTKERTGESFGRQYKTPCHYRVKFVPSKPTKIAVNRKEE